MTMLGNKADIGQQKYDNETIAECEEVLISQ